MSQENTDRPAAEDETVVRDAAGRRRFMRRGAALIVGGAPLLASGQALADCDRGTTDAEAKRAQAASSDSDQGAKADYAGCGRREAPKISQALPDGAPAPVTVDTVKG